ncbi:3-deoxy-D-manno-octulosonic-acid transferase [Shimia gijangensis]|uniref:3-deoxy-D-manno-octulosonic acid transferase n=1 Tax=Shimia gijangensis TaxID=1470563 RepID=A0A1M6L1Q0_9RHOB|nr:3-deoxy-D-manno-octulosonic acid transferase [Shimia gijangensis]SHJ65161.1 3-deoxy-D-manno-octulosonic-acid transferase [Shimia gijangensis]
MAPAPLTLTYQLYRLLTALGAPIAKRTARKRFEARNGPAERFDERSGHASLPRPSGRLIWMHAVSVGEFLSILDLVQDITATGVQVLVTTTTSSAADLAAQRLSHGVLHQFSPLDTPQATRRFLDHWHPDLAVFVESEIWPNQIVMAHARGIPLALINARLSASSLKQWQKKPDTARSLLIRFDAIMTQTDGTRTALQSLGVLPDQLAVTGDMKAAAAAQPVDHAAAQTLESNLSGRPLWVASSSHDGEEADISAAHRIVTAKSPDALLILAPRHPERGDAVEALLRAEGWTVARRSKAQPITGQTQIYLADTLGETGLWYSLAPIVFIAGSFTTVGGHNPYEPAHFDCAVLHGPHYANFELAYTEMHAANACQEVQDGRALGQTVSDLFGSAQLAVLQTNAKTFVTGAKNARGAVVQKLIGLIK